MSGAERLYLDHNATTPLGDAARQAMVHALDVIGNASSVHAEGRAARGVIEEARQQIATLAGAAPRQVIFTSGGTEANNLALGPGLRRASEKAGAVRLIISAIEHASGLQGHRFTADAVDLLPVTGDGVVDLAALTDLLARARQAGERVLVSVMLANNETGVIQPLPAIAALVHESGGVVHCDAIQGAGRLDVTLRSLGADLVTMSAHKIGGPQGAGALVMGADIVLGPPMLRGGGQEQYRRAGTENLAGIAGFGAAAAASRDNPALMPRIEALRDRLEEGVLRVVPGARIFGRDVARIANTSNFALPGLKAETTLIAFDLEGIALSSGSACSSGKVNASHVLKAMGVSPEMASGALRVSLGLDAQEAHIDRFLQVLARIAEKAGVQAAA